MSRLLLSLLLFAGIELSAQYWEEVRPIQQSANQLWKQQKLLDGSHEHAGYFADREWPGLWSYWYIKTGHSLADFQLAPLSFKTSAASAWKCPFWHIPSQDTPVICGVYGYLAATAAAPGLGIAFCNPMPHTIKVNVEGSLRNYQNNWDDVFYLFKQNSAGERELLKSSLAPEATYEVPGKILADRTAGLPRKYFRLGVSCDLAAGERLFLMIYASEVRVVTRSKGKWLLRFCLDEGQGKYYRPLFVVTDTSPRD